MGDHRTARDGEFSLWSYLIKLMEKLRLVRDVKLPPVAVLREGRVGRARRAREAAV